MKAAGWHDGVLYCYGGCGLRYQDFPRDMLLPTSLWNQVAVGEPFDETQQGIEREGRGGVLCPSCIMKRLAALPDCTVIYAGIDPEDRYQLEAQLAEMTKERDEWKKLTTTSLAELHGYQDGFEGMPMVQNEKTSHDNMAYVLWFGKARSMRSTLIDAQEVIERRLSEEREKVQQLEASLAKQIKRTWEVIDQLHEMANENEALRERERTAFEAGGDSARSWDNRKPSKGTIDRMFEAYQHSQQKDGDK